MAIKGFSLTEERDLPLLLFLWKWKLLSTAALGEKFFKDYKTLAGAYNRLLRFEEKGIIAHRPDEKFGHGYWALTLMGYRAIRDTLPALREEGYRSEHVFHDAMVTAFHLGDWLISAPTGSKLFSEQQLRRHDLESYPEWIPRTNDHRPDGYWGIPSKVGITAIALEVELTQKSTTEYEKVAEFYADEPAIRFVFWLVPSRAAGNRLHSAMNKPKLAKPNMHNFVLLKDFQRLCWGSPFAVGSLCDSTPSSFFNRIRENHDRIPVESRWKSTTHPLLDTKKSYTKFKTSAPAPVFQKSY